jgi:hypothetical protein
MLTDNDPVNHPFHYTLGSIEVIDVIEDWQLSYHLGNAVKYIARAKHKGEYIQDLKKAVWYLQREIDKHVAPPSLSEKIYQQIVP